MSEITVTQLGSTPTPKLEAPELQGLDPGELIARGLQADEPSSGLWEPPTPEQLAVMLPQYRIECLLGRGGMGAVYRGVQEALARPVAIKLLPAEMSHGDDFVARFQREARLLAKLQHPGIVTVYGFGQTNDGNLYFVMEYVEGTDLNRLLRGPGLDPEQAFELFGQICDALDYAHRQDVIHRDIKPGNILVTHDGRTKLADFGLARPMNEDHCALTLSGVVMGTPAYMAPEQREGIADHRSDIYTLGVLLYEMLAGRRPEGIFRPLSSRVAVSPRLDQVIIKSLQHDPERRYQMVSELKADVEHARGVPVVATTPAGRETKPRKPRWIAALGGSAVAALALGGFLLTQRGGQPAESKPLPAAATKTTPFTNSLGMKFAPLPGTPALMCIHETRREDYAAFAAASAGVHESWKYASWQGLPVSSRADEPVVNVNWNDARAFCAWLSKKEGRTYRLPTDREWSIAVGLASEPAGTPAALNKKIANVYPWGAAWPPPGRAGNFADASVGARHAFIQGYTDGFTTTAPVMSFTPNTLGIHDLGGNVLEWCEDWFDATQKSRVLRGGAWLGYGDRFLLSSCRYREFPPETRHIEIGFRCVLDTSNATAPSR